MSQANEILENLTEEELSAYSAIPEGEPHIVIDDDRIITVPVELQKIAVQFDHDIETVTFDCPRYWDGHDLSAMKIYINYTRADGIDGCYRAQNVVIDDTDDTIMHFNWTISRNVSEAFGMLSFSVCAKKVDENGNEENHWNSEINREMTISEGKACDETVKAEYPDVITQLFESHENMVKHVDSLEKEFEAAIDSAIALCDSYIDGGAE